MSARVHFTPLAGWVSTVLRRWDIIPKARGHPGGARCSDSHPWTTEGGARYPARRDVSNVAAKLARRTTAPEWKAPQALAQRDARASTIESVERATVDSTDYTLGLDAARRPPPPLPPPSAGRTSLANLRKLRASQ